MFSENDDENLNQDSRKKRRRILGPEFGSIDLESEEGRKLMAAKSKHVGAVLEVNVIINTIYIYEILFLIT